MLRSQIEAELLARRTEYESISKDFKRISNLIYGLQEQLKRIGSRKSELQIKIEELEDEINDDQD